MYRTDKQFMKDPATAPARIYVGGLSELVVPDNLEEKFNQHGKVLGMLLQKGFAFIQYETEDQAHAAINAENGKMFYNRKLVVRQVYEGKNKSMQHKVQAPNNSNQPNQPLNSGALPNINQNAPSNNLSVNNDAPPIQLMPQENEELLPKPMWEDKRLNKRKFWNRNDRKQQQQIENYRDAPPYFEEKFQPSPQIPPYVPPPVIDTPEKNDCEIIVVSKLLTEYAEYIEKRLKASGLIVDLLFPNEDVPLGRVLANISSRGCLYAILIMPQNEENRSLTLNILHGVPQEHRNIPIEDAMILLMRNFDAYMRGEKMEVDKPASTLAEKHPESFQMLFNLLAENRQLSTNQYDKVIKYLQDRRELQKTFEGDEGDSSGDTEHVSKEAELQNRIMNILNKPSAEPVKPPAPSSTAPTPLLNDPSVQKALDSLLSGDMFKSISAGI